MTSRQVSQHIRSTFLIPQNEKEWHSDLVATHSKSPCVKKVVYMLSSSFFGINLTLRSYSRQYHLSIVEFWLIAIKHAASSLIPKGTSIFGTYISKKYIKGKEIVITSTGVAKTKRYWMASIKTPGLDLARPTAHIACSSPLYSGH